MDVHCAKCDRQILTGEFFMVCPECRRPYCMECHKGLYKVRRPMCICGRSRAGNFDPFKLVP